MDETMMPQPLVHDVAMLFDGRIGRRVNFLCLFVAKHVMSMPVKDENGCLSPLARFRALFPPQCLSTLLTIGL